jgi:shikimate kinase
VRDKTTAEGGARLRSKRTNSSNVWRRPGGDRATAFHCCFLGRSAVRSIAHGDAEPFPNLNAADVNLYLVGFMGTGKTTVGRAVAHKLGFTLLDSDHEIERLAGRTIADIFATEGEPAFRAMERDFIENGHPAERTVVACGGGLVVQPGMLPLLKSKGVVVCLHASIETILARTARHHHRPLLIAEDPEERVRTLYAAREPVYRQAGTLILTDARPLHDITGHVMRAWRRDAQDFVRTLNATSR